MRHTYHKSYLCMYPCVLTIAGDSFNKKISSSINFDSFLFAEQVAW